MKTPRHRNTVKTHCPQGHPYDIRNTRYRRIGARVCKSCESSQAKRYYAKTRRAVLGHSKREYIRDRTIHKVWAGMKSRCNNVNEPSYKEYGGRGIKVCDRWNKYNNFYKDMMNGYKKGLTLNRVDNNGNYELDNCEWATPKQQANNTRRNRMITYKGVTKTMQQWADEIGIQTSTLRYRLNKWSVARALTERLN